MKSVNMHQAKSSLSAIVEAVESGAEPEVIIARNGRPAARLVPMARPAEVGKRLGVAEGRFDVPDNIDEDEDEIIALFEGRAA